MVNNAPKYFPGTDIEVNDSIPDSIMVKSSTVKLSGKFKKIKSENKFIRYSLTI